ncbi:MAG: hypothetical protein HQM08_11085 [Candidatus Riflebacteria bacterium]|nr:hypothetical protein [Candidatus Riflebacteria bacterium]
MSKVKFLSLVCCIFLLSGPIFADFATHPHGQGRPFQWNQSTQINHSFPGNHVFSVHSSIPTNHVFTSIPTYPTIQNYPTQHSYPTNHTFPPIHNYPPIHTFPTTHTYPTYPSYPSIPTVPTVPTIPTYPSYPSYPTNQPYPGNSSNVNPNAAPVLLLLSMVKTDLEMCQNSMGNYMDNLLAIGHLNNALSALSRASVPGSYYPLVAELGTRISRIKFSLVMNDRDNARMMCSATARYVQTLIYSLSGGQTYPTGNSGTVYSYPSTSTTSQMGQPSFPGSNIPSHLTPIN